MSDTLGALLVEAGRVSSDDMTRALEEQRATGAPLGQTLVDLGLLPDAELGVWLAKQRAVRYPSGRTVLEYGLAVADAVASASGGT